MAMVAVPSRRWGALAPHISNGTGTGTDTACNIAQGKMFQGVRPPSAGRYG
jgi:hypothetical protein